MKNVLKSKMNMIKRKGNIHSNHLSPFHEEKKKSLIIVAFCVKR